MSNTLYDAVLVTHIFTNVDVENAPGSLELKYNLQTWNNKSCPTSNQDEYWLNKTSIFIGVKSAEMLNVTYNDRALKGH